MNLCVTARERVPADAARELGGAQVAAAETEGAQDHHQDHRQRPWPPPTRSVTTSTEPLGSLQRHLAAAQQNIQELWYAYLFLECSIGVVGPREL